MLAAFRDKLLGHYERLDEKDIERAIDIIITETDPRLRMVRAYKRKLRKPVIRSLAYINNLVTRIPGPFEINRRAYGTDPQINALFGSADDIETLFSHSKPVREFFRDSPGSDRVYLPLAMWRTEKKVFGAALRGDVIRKDVAQTAVNFSGHWLGICGASETELRQMLIWRGIHNLAITALENITGLQTRTDALKKQRTLLKMKLRGLQSQHLGLDAPEETQDDNAVDLQTLKQRLEETEHELASASTTLETLDGYLRQVCKVFSHPSRYLRVKPNAVRVNRMGIRSDNGNSRDAARIITATITIGNKPQFETILVAFPRAAMGEPPGMKIWEIRS
ncbi:MAG: hypothetical protein EP297_02750 [Gammaproteobacteria bacterium]|nr:MAG: hypothetical protein EP297_02750 [Gammaproteobacteria bacterium]